jgi:hypothetical protein
LFLDGLDGIIRSLYKVNSRSIVCGDINIDYLVGSERKRQLDAMLLSYNLSATVHFPTRTKNQSSTAIDNIFIDIYKFINYSVSPLYNGLSDYDAQLLKIKEVNFKHQNYYVNTIRNINKHSIEEFKLRLSYESWDSIFDNNNMDIDSLFNIFLNNYLRIFYTSFTLHKTIQRSNKSWITTGIKISCNHKKDLYLLSRDSNDINLKEYYKQYCKILSSVIKEAKQLTYNNKIINYSNKMKTTWNIIKSETGRLNGHTTSKYQNTPDTFNKYFSSIAGKIIQNINCSNIKGTNNNVTPKYYLSDLSNNSFSNMKFKNTSTKEIEKIINSFKSNNSHGYDKICTKILKVSAPFISSPLNYICNKSILSGTFPTRLKYSIVKPMYKVVQI